jgi:hypothetical protein
MCETQLLSRQSTRLSLFGTIFFHLGNLLRATPKTNPHVLIAEGIRRDFSYSSDRFAHRRRRRRHF